MIDDLKAWLLKKFGPRNEQLADEIAAKVFAGSPEIKKAEKLLANEIAARRNGLLDQLKTLDKEERSTMGGFVARKEKAQARLKEIEAGELKTLADELRYCLTAGAGLQHEFQRRRELLRRQLTALAIETFEQTADELRAKWQLKAERQDREEKLLNVEAVRILSNQFGGITAAILELRFDYGGKADEKLLALVASAEEMLAAPPPIVQCSVHKRALEFIGMTNGSVRAGCRKCLA